jgi:hypothetical protein
MHQTIYGETHKKVKVLERSVIDKFEKKHLNSFIDSIDFPKCIYSNLKTIDSDILNFINYNNFENEENILRNLIINEYDKCNNLYPYLGDIFIKLFFHFFEKNNFNLKDTKKRKLFFSKTNVKKFINHFENKSIEEISSWFFQNCTKEYLVKVDYVYENNIIVKKEKGLHFKNIEFDNSFFKNDFLITNYNFFILDGYIDSISELHHLLVKASENKENYVIFCSGISNDVKKTIQINNEKNITKVYPVSFDVNEENLNILNDIAVIHNSENKIISAQKGQTLSQVIGSNNSMQKGVKILIKDKNILLTPLASDEKIHNHKLFLMKRIEAQFNEKNKNLLINRYQRFNLKRVNIHLPDSLSKNINFINEINYFLMFIKNIDKKFIVFQSKKMKKDLYIPELYVKITIAKVKSLTNIFKKLSKMIIFESK